MAQYGKVLVTTPDDQSSSRTHMVERLPQVVLLPLRLDRCPCSNIHVTHAYIHNTYMPTFIYTYNFKIQKKIKKS